MPKKKTTASSKADNQPDHNPEEETEQTTKGQVGKSASGAASKTPGKHEDTGNTPAAASDEIGGPSGPEPTRYGDWEIGGKCVDF